MVMKILADGGEYWRIAEKYWRMARNTGGWREILAYSGEYWRMARKIQSLKLFTHINSQVPPGVFSFQVFLS
jgi:hypothetical protein